MIFRFPFAASPTITAMLIHAPFHALPVNATGRDFVVGDVHGHGRLLDQLLATVAFDAERDRLIALGDLIDRGPDSLDLLTRVEREPWLYSLRGNHEAMLRDSLHSVMSALLWYRNGGEWGQEIPDATLQALARIVDGLPLALTLPLPDGRRVGLVHAEVPIGRSWREIEALAELPDSAFGGLSGDDDANPPFATSMLWGRQRIGACEGLRRVRHPERLPAERRERLHRALAPVPDVDLVIAGHSYSADRRPVACGNLLFIDTGVFEPDGRLTLVEPLQHRCWQAAYAPDGQPRVLVTEGEPLPTALRLSSAQAAPSPR